MTLQKTVLTIDDDDLVRKSLKNYLEDCEFRVLEASNGEDGLVVFNEKHPDIVLVDLRMPKVDGLDVLSGVVTKSPNTPVIIISGTGVISDVVEALHLGAWDYHLKPLVDMEILLVSIRKCLARAELIKNDGKYKEHLEEEVRRRTFAYEKANLELTKEIEERKKADLKLAESEMNLNSIIRSVHDLIYRLDTDSKITFISDSIGKYGYKPEELLGHSMFDIIHPDDRDGAVFQINQNRTAERMTSDFEFRMIVKLEDRAPDLESCPVFLLEAEGIYEESDPEQPVFMGTLGTARNITRRIQAEEALKESEARFRRIAENVNDIIFRKSVPDDRFEFISSACEEILGYRAHDIYKNKMVMSNFIHPSFRYYYEKRLKKLVRDGMNEELEYLIENSRNEERWLYQRNIPVRDSHGTLVAIEGIIMDITRKKKIEEGLRLSQKMEAIGTLAGGIAHDFNNILASIIGYTDLMNIGLEGDRMKDNYLHNIKSASERAVDLVKQILTFSSSPDKERHPLQIDLVIKDALKLLEAAIPKTIEIKKNISKTSWYIMAGSTQIHQVVMNLFANAKHAIGDQNGTISITLETPDDRDGIKPSELKHSNTPWIRLSVSDTGYGMGSKVRERIFEPYFTTKEKGVGSGLGLAVVHGIVKGCGGVIEVSSTPGEGTVFDVFFPGIKSTGYVKRNLNKTFRKGKGENVLLVDDEKDITDSSKKLLEFLGYRVTDVTNPETALGLFMKNPDAFDVVVTDMTMPQMTGLTLAGELILIRPDIPVILCTGYSENITDEKIASCGIRKFVMKPVNATKLSELIQEVLYVDSGGKFSGLIK